MAQCSCTETIQTVFKVFQVSFLHLSPSCAHLHRHLVRPRPLHTPAKADIFGTGDGELGQLPIRSVKLTSLKRDNMGPETAIRKEPPTRIKAKSHKSLREKHNRNNVYNRNNIYIYTYVCVRELVYIYCIYLYIYIYMCESYRCMVFRRHLSLSSPSGNQAHASKRRSIFFWTSELLRP